MVYRNGAESMDLDNWGEVVKQSKVTGGFNSSPEEIDNQHLKLLFILFCLV